MCNETKVNTNNPQSSPADEKNVAVNTTPHVGSISVPYGTLSIDRGGADDHLAMRSRQLCSLLRLMQGEGTTPAMNRLNDFRQHSLLWLAQQLADEIEEALPFVQEPAPRRQYESTPLS